MALLKAAEVRAMRPEDRQKRLGELRTDLIHERGVAAMGGSPPSPGKIRQLRTAIARILTIQNQDRAGAIQYTKREQAKGQVPPPAKAPAKPAKPAPKPKTAAKKSEASKPSKAKAAPAAKPKGKPKEE